MLGQGPVDPQNPTVTPRDTAPTPPAAVPSAAPSAAPTPRVSPVPTIALPPPPAPRASERPQPQPAAPRLVEAPRPETRAPISQESTAAPPSPAPVATPSSVTTQAAAPQPSPTISPEAGLAPHWPEWWLAIPAALVAAGVGVLLLLRRRRAPATAWEEAGLEPEAEPEDEIEQELPVAAPVAALEPVSPVTPIPRVQPSRNPEPQERTRPAPASPPPPTRPGVIAVDFEPISLRLSLVYATLQYRLTLSAPTARSAPSWRLLGDMISAHASLSQGEQLAPEPADLPLRHTFETLAPGETRTVTGELQLPLNAIRVMRQGQASLFVPLVRICLTDEQGHIERRVFTLGLPGNGPGLAPVRLDTGPRDHAAIAAREIEAARDIGQDPDSSFRRRA